MSEIILSAGLDEKIYLAIYPLLKRGEMRLIDNATIADIVNDIRAGNKQLWLIYEGTELLSIVITAIVYYGSDKHLLYYLMVGDDIDACLNHYDEIAEWARSHGCVGVELFGRRGWEKKLKKHNFKVKYVCMASNL